MGRRACAGLWIAGVVVRVLGAPALYGRAVSVDEGEFADRATAALAQDEVQDEIGARLTNRAIEAHPGLDQLRPTVEGAVSDAVASWTFPGHFRAGAAAMHRALFAGDPVDLAL